MDYASKDKSSLLPPFGMTSITGQKLDALKAIYHDLVGAIVQPSSEESLLFSHFGDFDQAKNDAALKMVESVILEAGDKRQVMKRVCGLLIEVLQNMSLHAARDRNSRMHAYLILSRCKDCYKMLTANLVLAEDIDSLNNRMTELSKLDQNELRKLYIEVLCNEEFSHKGGAGLGLMTVARRADQNLNFAIQKIDDSFGYFQLELKMSNR